MVHALQTTSDLVRPGGKVVVVHDSRIPPAIMIHRGGEAIRAGHLQDSEGFPMIRLADQAIEVMTNSHQLEVSRQRVFTYQTWIETREGLEEWMDKLWDTSFITAQLEEQVVAALEDGDRESFVSVHWQARIQSLRVV